MTKVDAGKKMTVKQARAIALLLEGVTITESAKRLGIIVAAICTKRAAPGDCAASTI